MINYFYLNIINSSLSLNNYTSLTDGYDGYIPLLRNILDVPFPEMRLCSTWRAHPIGRKYCIIIIDKTWQAGVTSSFVSSSIICFIIFMNVMCDRGRKRGEGWGGDQLKGRNTCERANRQLPWRLAQWNLTDFHDLCASRCLAKILPASEASWCVRTFSFYFFNI